MRRKCEASGRSGWWFRFNTLLGHHHPVRSIKGSFAIFLYVSLKAMSRSATGHVLLAERDGVLTLRLGPYVTTLSINVNRPA